MDSQQLTILIIIILVLSCINTLAIVVFFFRNSFANSFDMLSKIKRSKASYAEESIISMVNEGQEQGVLEAEEAKMINNIFEMGDKEAGDIMTHRKNIDAIDGGSTLEEALEVIFAGKNSRYPVYIDDLDNVFGILHIKDALRLTKDDANRNKTLKELSDSTDCISEAKFIPETRNVQDLFKMMKAEKVHLAMVIDEYGQTCGLVTLEDVLEEIVGNILDEYDEEEVHIEEKDDSTYVMEGMTTLEEVSDLLSIDFEEDVDTLNGFLLAKLGKLPEEGEQPTVEYEGFNFAVKEFDNKMILSVEVTKLPDQES